MNGKNKVRDERMQLDLAAQQVSLSEWFEDMGYNDSEKFRAEDKSKDERLKVLQKVIDLPITPVIEFEAERVVAGRGAFAEYYNQHAADLCGFKLIPKRPDLPKHRIRGLTLREAVGDWMGKQEVDATNYLVQVLPHTSQVNWSAIVVVNKGGIFGEVLAGTLFELSTGLYTESTPHVFSFNEAGWRIDPAGYESMARAQQVVQHLLVKQQDLRAVLREEVGAEFWGEYLKGYFEVVDDDLGLHFHDYNRLLGKMVRSQITKAGGGDLVGRVGSPGRSSGRVRIVGDPAEAKFLAGDVLVCDMTSPLYLPLMRQASAIVTDRGGALCHASIVARELGVPCVVGTKKATQVLKDGDEVEVDADKGIVRIIKRVH